MVLSDQRDMPDGCHKPIKLNTRSLNQRTTAQRFSTITVIGGRGARLSDAGAEFDSLGDLAGRGQQPSPPNDLQSVLPRACARVVPGVNILTTFLSNLLNLLKMKMIMIKGARRAHACACARPDHQSGVKPLPRS